MLSRCMLVIYRWLVIIESGIFKWFSWSRCLRDLVNRFCRHKLQAHERVTEGFIRLQQFAQLMQQLLGRLLPYQRWNFVKSWRNISFPSCRLFGLLLKKNRQQWFIIQRTFYLQISWFVSALSKFTVFRFLSNIL